MCTSFSDLLMPLHFFILDAYSTIQPEHLHHAKMKVIPQSKCEKSYPGKIKDSMMCAGYDLGQLDTCKVMRIRHILVTIASMAIFISIMPLCNAVYIKVLKQNNNNNK